MAHCLVLSFGLLCWMLFYYTGGKEKRNTEFDSAYVNRLECIRNLGGEEYTLPETLTHMSGV